MLRVSKIARGTLLICQTTWLTSRVSAHLDHWVHSPLSALHGFSADDGKCDRSEACDDSAFAELDLCLVSIDKSISSKHVADRIHMRWWSPILQQSVVPAAKSPRWHHASDVSPLACQTLPSRRRGL